MHVHWVHSSVWRPWESLCEDNKNLRNLKFTKIWFFDLDTKSEVKELFPNCNVEFKNCKFGPNWVKQDSNSERVNDGNETNDVLDNFNEREIELMFTQVRI